MAVRINEVKRLWTEPNLNAPGLEGRLFAASDRSLEKVGRILWAPCPTSRIRAGCRIDPPEFGLKGGSVQGRRERQPSRRPFGAGAHQNEK